MHQFVEQSSPTHRTTIACAILAVAGVVFFASTTPRREAAVQQAGLQSVRIRTEPGTFAAMMRALSAGDAERGHKEGGDRPWQKAEYRDESDKWQGAEIALHGVRDWHHQPDKPSLRVRIDAEDVRLGQRDLELTRPTDALALEGWLPAILGRELGLVSASREHVVVRLDDRDAGVYLRAARPSEWLALENGRLPGTFYAPDEPPARRRDLWSDPKAWRDFGEDDAAKAALATAFATLRLPASARALTELYRALDGDVFARWAALMVTCGCIPGAREDLMLFFCSNQGRLEAVPWQSRAFHTDPQLPVDATRHPFVARLLCDPRWVHARDRALHALVTGVARPQALAARIDAMLTRVGADLRSDPGLAQLVLREGRWRLVPVAARDLPAQRERLSRWITARHDHLSSYIADARVAVAAATDRTGWTRVTVFGNVGVRATDRKGAAVTDPRTDLDVLLPGRSERLYDTNGAPHTRPAPLEYLVPGTPESLRFVNAHTGRTVRPTPAPAPLPTRSVPPSAFPPEPTGEVLLGPGEVILTDDLEVGPRQSLRIVAGTTVRLGPGVGIHSRGPTRIEGTTDEPVALVPLGKKPWGALAIHGAATAGSRLRGLAVAGGTPELVGFQRFKGMVSVYDCPDIELVDCSIGRNAKGDEAVSIGESRVLIQGCTFRDVLADALDLERCRGAVRDCTFTQSGNDALDLMTCDLVVEDCEFRGSGDKGISIGERSRVVVRRCRIVDCEVGVECKDASAALFETVRFVDNETGWHSYQKRFEYQRAGRGCLVECTFEGSDKHDVDLQKRSELVLVRTKARASKGSDKRVEESDRVPDFWAGLAATVLQAGR